MSAQYVTDLNALKVLDRKATADLLGICTKTLDRLREDGKFPPPVRVTERCLGWQVGTLRDWLASKTQADAA